MCITACGCDLVSDLAMNEPQSPTLDQGTPFPADMAQELDFGASLDDGPGDLPGDLLEADQDMTVMLPEAKTHFVTTWDTRVHDPEDATLHLAMGEGTFNFDVDWENDGVFDQLHATAALSHTYPQPGVYTVRIRGVFPHFVVSSGPTDATPKTPESLKEAGKLQSVDQWGTLMWTSMKGAFKGARNLQILAKDRPDLSRVSDTSWMFAGASSFNRPIEHWDMSTVTTVESMFEGATSFNQPLASWNTSRFNSLKRMFANAATFNQPIGAWNTSRVTSLETTFGGAAAFDQPLEMWNTSRVNSMASTFVLAGSFDQPLGAWDTSKVNTMRSMFERAKAFNQPLEAWNTSSVTSMEKMFMQASAFDQPLGAWDTSKVKDMKEMFYLAVSFNQPVGTWNTSNVTVMEAMFKEATAFDQPLGAWDTSKVSSMRSMFESTRRFDQAIGTWDLSAATDIDFMLRNAGLSTANYDSLLIGWNAQPSLPKGLRLDAKNLTYCNGQAAREALKTEHGWTIVNDMPACP